MSTNQSKQKIVFTTGRNKEERKKESEEIRKALFQAFGPNIRVVGSSKGMDMQTVAHTLQHLVEEENKKNK